MWIDRGFKLIYHVDAVKGMQNTPKQQIWIVVVDSHGIYESDYMR